MKMTSKNEKMKTTSKKNEKNEDDLKKFKICSQFLLNLGANLSWGWLSSLRLFMYVFTRKLQ